jgi:TPR repeat protein
MKLIPLFLLVGMLAVSGWAEEYNLEPYSPELVKKAEAGDPKAQFDLGEYYERKYYAAPSLSHWNPIWYLYPKGYRAEREMGESLKWYKKAAQQGYAPAQSYLSIRYYFGIRVPKDYMEAVKLCAKAAEQGNRNGENMLGLCYANGNGVTQDYKEAVKWYKKAAQQGLAPAQFNLGRFYANGEGVTKDMKEAVKWWTKAAEQGDADAKEELEKLKSK